MKLESPTNLFRFLCRRIFCRKFEDKGKTSCWDPARHSFPKNFLEFLRIFWCNLRVFPISNFLAYVSLKFCYIYYSNNLCNFLWILFKLFFAFKTLFNNFFCKLFICYFMLYGYFIQFSYFAEFSPKMLPYFIVSTIWANKLKCLWNPCQIFGVKGFHKKIEKIR